MDGSAVLLTTTALILLSVSPGSTELAKQSEVHPTLDISLILQHFTDGNGDDVTEEQHPLPDDGVQFPPGRPSSKNIQAICLNADHRPYHAQPARHLYNKAKAVNQAESWFRTCCDRNETWAQEWTLCCAKQAWELVLNSFCDLDLSIKHRVHDCCRVSGKESLDCFEKKAPNPNYKPTETEPVPPPPVQEFFNFDNRTCVG